MTLHYGEVPMGDSVELLVLRKGLAREFRPDGTIGLVRRIPTMRFARARRFMIWWRR